MKECELYTKLRASRDLILLSLQYKSANHATRFNLAGLSIVALTVLNTHLI